MRTVVRSRFDWKAPTNRGMDNLTHGLLGMAVAVCIAPRESCRQAAWVGFLAGEFPDLDVFLRSVNDPLFGLAMHRHFTHSCCWRL